MSEKKTKARRGTPGRKVPKAKRARAAAAVLVEGMSLRQAADAADTSTSTVKRAVEEVQSDEDLARYVTEYRAKALPKWLEVIDKGAEAALNVMPKSSGRDIAALVKVFGDMSNRAAGEADVTHDHRGQLEGARESLAARIATLADSRAKGSGS